MNWPLFVSAISAFATLLTYLRNEFTEKDSSKKYRLPLLVLLTVCIGVSIFIAKEGTKPSATLGNTSPATQDTSGEINAAINKWRDALLSNDPNRLADCYARRIDRYFLQTNVTHDYVQQYIRKLHDRGDAFRDERISQLSIQMTSDSTAEAQFIESFDSFTAGQDKKRTVRTILHFIREEGAWKISFERQLKISS